MLKEKHPEGFKFKCYKVLILILMEHAQREYTTAIYIGKGKWSLNPYFNGTCSKSMVENEGIVCNRIQVLILILMEHAQRAGENTFLSFCSKRLNPYFNGTCSKRAFFVRPYVLICYVVKFTLINVFVLIKCTCFMQKIVQR